MEGADELFYGKIGEGGAGLGGVELGSWSDEEVSGVGRDLACEVEGDVGVMVGWN